MKAIVNRTIKKLEKEKELLGKRRDSLRALLSEIEDLAEHCDTAIEDLERAVDSLSELV